MDDKTLEDALIAAVHDIFEGAREELSVNTVRKQCETDHGLGEGFFGTGEWKAKSKTIIKGRVVSFLILFLFLWLGAAANETGGSSNQGGFFLGRARRSRGKRCPAPETTRPGRRGQRTQDEEEEGNYYSFYYGRKKARRARQEKGGSSAQEKAKEGAAERVGGRVGAE